MTDIITKFTIFFFFDFLSCLVFETSVHEDELDIFFLSSVLTDDVMFLIIDLLFCEKKSIMKDSIKESVKKLISLTVKNSMNSTVKDSILKTSAVIIFFSIEFSLILIL